MTHNLVEFFQRIDDHDYHRLGISLGFDLVRFKVGAKQRTRCVLSRDFLYNSGLGGGREGCREGCYPVDFSSSFLYNFDMCLPNLWRLQKKLPVLCVLCNGCWSWSWSWRLALDTHLQVAVLLWDHIAVCFFLPKSQASRGLLKVPEDSWSYYIALLIG